MIILQMRSAFINCIENYSAKLIFETILETVEKARGGDFEMLTRKKCDNFNDFVRNLREILTTSNPNDKKFFIIFKKAERLRSMESNLLMGLMNLAELCNMNVCVILVTEITVENFLSGTGFVIPMLVHFDQYYQKELVKIMTLDCPNGFDETFYATYCQLLVSVFYLACRDLNELKHLVCKDIPSFLQTIHLFCCSNTTTLFASSSHKGELPVYTIKYEFGLIKMVWLGCLFSSSFQDSSYLII